MATHPAVSPVPSDQIQPVNAPFQVIESDGIHKGIPTTEGSAQDQTDMHRMGKIQEFKV